MSSTSFSLNNEMVWAGAGAGKTTALTKKVLEVAFEFFRQHQRFPRLIVTTFTRLATQELRERLIVEGIKTGREDFLDFLASRSHLHISTIHGVLSLFLHRYGHLLEMDANFQVLSEKASLKRVKNILRQMLLEEPQYTEILEVWSFQELVPMLRKFHACTLMSDQAHFTDPKQLEGLLQFYLRDEIQVLENILFELNLMDHQNVNQKMNQKMNQKVNSISWPDSWKEYGLRQSEIIQTLKHIKSPADWESMENLSSRLGRRPSYTAKIKEILSPEINEQWQKTWNDLQSKLKKPGIKPHNWESYIKLQEKFQCFAQDFHFKIKQIKEKTGQLEMSDLELMTWHQLQKYPEVGSAFSQEWDYWLIDEFQDTSPLQVKLLHQLMAQKPAFVVGDPQQSIYLFRGARSEVFQKKWDEMGEKKALRKEKITNYRSHPSLLIFLNDLFRGIGNQFRPMEPKPLNESSNDSSEESQEKLSKEKSKKEVARWVQIIIEGDKPSKQKAEIQSLLEHLYQLRSQGVPFEEIGILARTNQQLEEVALVLKKYGFPYHLHAARGFYQRREIEDVGIVWQFLLNPHNNENLIALLRSPFFRVSDVLICHWLMQKPSSLWNFLELSSTHNHPAIARLKKYLQATQEVGCLTVLRQIIFQEGYLGVSFHYDSTGQREANLWKFLNQMEELSRSPQSRFLEWGGISERAGNLDQIGDEESEAVSALEPSRIQLMTIHAAKGLQFSHVLLPFCHSYSQGHDRDLFVYQEESQTWGVSFRNDQEDGETQRSLLHLVHQTEMRKRELKEHQRLLYVALTRAKESIYLSWQNDNDIDKGSWAESLSSWVAKEGWNERPHYGFWVKKITSLDALDIEIEEEKQLPVSPVSSIKSVLSPVAVDSQKLISSAKSPFSVSDYLEEKMSLPQWSQVDSGKDSVQERIKARAQGILIHRVMEILHYHKDFDFEPLLKDWFGEERESVRAALKFIRESQNPPLTQLISQGHVEWGFQLPTRKGILEGQIDLWGVDEQGGYWLIDYKSGSDRFIKKAFFQLSLYSLALRQMSSPELIQLAVIYPLESKIKIQKAPELDELKILFPELF